jgi:hypothetical protein
MQEKFTVYAKFFSDDANARRGATVIHRDKVAPDASRATYSGYLTEQPYGRVAGALTVLPSIASPSASDT